MKISIPQVYVDPDFQKYIEVLEDFQDVGNKILKEITIESQKMKKATPSFFISIVIMQRALECMSSTKLLVVLGHRRDAAILLLNLIELRLDLMYIALDDKHADEWLNHDKEHIKPWKVGHLFKALYSELGELKAEQNNYKKFSMAKHGNPLGGLMSFPIEVTNRALLIHKEKEPPYSSIIYFFACGVELYRICNATLDIARQLDYEIEGIRQALEDLNITLRDFFDRDTLKTVHELVNSLEKPQLCDRCCAVPKGKIEITCLIRQSNYKREKLFDEKAEFICESFVELK
ncbi:MAG: hypothetical protein WD469_14820 [Paenibacillaceae bacterium]